MLLLRGLLSLVSLENLRGYDSEGEVDIPAVVSAFDNSLSVDGPIVEVLRILTKLSYG